MYPAKRVAAVLSLAESGCSQATIARETGVSRTTIRTWLRGDVPARGRSRARASCFRCGGAPAIFQHRADQAYAYLLGLYLGDGWLTRHPRGVFRLHVALDSSYPVIVSECEAAASLTMPTSKVAIVRRTDGNLFEVRTYSKHWPCVFPQHGPGRKHHRSIALEDWQRRIVNRYPWRLLRGMIHSDGCRCMNRIRHPKKVYVYPRYFFSNRSDDIRALFCEYCDRVGVEWRQTNRWDISVARRDSVALMDRYIGPKR